MLWFVQQQKMNKQDIVSDLCSADPNSNRAANKDIVDKVTGLIMSYVGQGHRVTIAGFGTFESRMMRPRKARNPRTGASVDVDACIKPVFRPSPKFKKMVIDGNVQKEK